MHRQRVADLSGRVAKALSVEPLVEFALTLAAGVHIDRPLETRAEHLLAEGRDSLTSLVVNITEAILNPRHVRFHGKLAQDIERSAQILEACDEFDEAVEFAVYERTSTRVAINEFLEAAEHRLDSRIVGTLRQLTSPDVSLALPGQLPVLPAAAAKLMRTSADSASVFELESIASSDPVLAGRLLAASNSAFFGIPSQIRVLKQAIQRLGIPLSRKVLMDASFGPLFASSTLAELWRHSQLVAATAHELAGECGYAQDVAYVAGLLHDIGRLVIERYPSGMHADETDRIASGFPRVYAETLVYGADHASIGSELLEKWRLPAEIVDAVACHHCPEITEAVLPSILYLAEDEVAIDALAHENLSAGMRRAAAMEITGVSEFSGRRINRQSAIFALTG
jgi:putative nucleotidyltransferase with HDIG domain